MTDILELIEKLHSWIIEYWTHEDWKLIQVNWGIEKENA